MAQPAENDKENPADADNDPPDSLKGKDPGVHKRHSILNFSKNQINFSLWYFIIAFVALIIFNQYSSRPPEKTIDFSEFKEKIRNSQIKRVEIGDKYADQPMDLADACLVKLSELHQDCRVITCDDDFFVYRRKERLQIPLIFPAKAPSGPA